MENVIGLVIESLVAVLLIATIVYCAVLDRRLRRLRSDEGMMRDTVMELVSATHAAERAIAGLRATVAQSEETLADRLGRAQSLSDEMAGQLGAGEEVIGRIATIAKAAREHTQRVTSRQDIERMQDERETMRMEVRREAERELEAKAAAVARLAAEPESRSAAAAAAAELFANRVRALSLGSAA